MVGRTLSHYEIRDEIGRGGMGIVYKARDVNLNRDVALKVLPPELVKDPERRLRFAQEAQAAAALQHPNVAVVYEIGEDDGTTFIAMELVPGEQLSSILSRGPIPPERAAALAVQIGAGLSKAHGTGVVHRDLNPSNILIGADDQVKIIDFGLAKLLAPPSEEGSEIQTAVHAKSSPGQIMGTLCYMSPEQITGQPVDHRTDLWAFGAVLYEMATGKRAFAGPNGGAITHAIANSDPELSVVPIPLRRIVSRALRKEAGSRYQSATEMVDDLVVLSAGRGESRPRRTAAIVGVAMVLAAAASWMWYQSSQVSWARTEALPEIQRLADDEDYAGAFALAQEAERVLGEDPALAELWHRISVEMTITSEPPGADVFMNEYEAVDEPWQSIGQTPIDNHRVPVGFRRVRVGKAGFVTEYRALPSLSIDVELVESGGVPDEMVRVPDLVAIPWLAGLDPLAGLRLKPFLVDRHEVTNAAYQRFVDDGGYQNEAWWPHDFVKEGRSLTLQEATESFLDATGRPGPATWQVGRHPKGEEAHPVSGVSWHEAAAYCASVDKSLPTIYHWISISGARGMAAAIVPLSNFEADGPSPAGEHRGMGPYGTFDTAGNLNEWCWNASGSERYLLGGSWSDPGYTFSHAQTRDPFDRSPINGFRCVRYANGPDVPEPPGRAIELVSRDYRSEQPVSDAVFEVYREQFGYDRTPLNPVIDENVASNERWTVERISLDAAYGEERLIVYLILPRDARPRTRSSWCIPDRAPSFGTTLIAIFGAGGALMSSISLSRAVVPSRGQSIKAPTSVTMISPRPGRTSLEPMSIGLLSGFRTSAVRWTT